MNKGKLYGVGVGPGDPELLTRKAVRLVQECDVLAVPDKGTADKTALKIVSEFVRDQEILYCPSPMVHDYDLWQKNHAETAEKICALLDQGKNVVFITLGDPTIYSTYIYVHQKVAARGYETELVPGIPSFCAAAARLGVSLCQNDERLLVVPGSCRETDTMDIVANKVFMKSGRAILDLQQQLREAGVLDRASLVENCSMETERVVPHFADLEEKTGYFSLVVVPQN